MAGPSVPCPLCGEPVPRSVRRCDNCGSLVPDEIVAGARALAETLKVDPETARKLAESGFHPAEVPAESGGGATLYLCPTCGAFVSSADVTCSKCGERLDEGTPAEESRPCPHCNAPIPVTARVCPACGTSLAAEDEEAISGLCPNCGSLAPTGRQTCAVCGASLRPGEIAAAPASPMPPSGEPAKPAPPPESPERAPGPRVAPRAVPKPRVAPAPALPKARPERKEVSPPKRSRVAESAPPVQARAESGPGRTEAPLARTSRTTNRLASLRELAALGTAMALPVAGAASLGNVAGREWGELFLFGVFFGLAIVLVAPDLRARGRERVAVLLWPVSLILLTAGALLAYVGSGAALAPLAVGTGLLALSAWRLRRDVGVYLAWAGGLLLLTVLAIAPVAFLSPGPVGGAMWALGGGLAFGASLVVVIRRYLRSAIDARLAHADEEYARRDYAKAVASYDAAIRLAQRAGQETPASWYGKGAALVVLGKYDEGLNALDRALALNPGNEIAWINKGTALTRMGRMTDALKCFNSAIKVNPTYEVAWNNKGNALARLGRQELALACYDRAIEIDPAYRTAWVNKGYVLAKLGRFEEATRCADAALRLTTGVPGA